MGGTFDPIHHGHLVAASEVRSWFGLREVIFVPTGKTYQKADRDVSPAEDRYLMTVIATTSNPAFRVSRVDIDRPGPTYTIDTLRDLKASSPDDELYFITGADALGDILGWRDPEQMRINDAMLRNLLDPLLAAAPGLAHVTLLQGTKAYGVHVEPVPVPARERWPRHPHDNFYWLQEDYLRERQAGSRWHFTILRPQVIFGESIGSAMNPIPAIGVYAALLKAQGKEELL